MLQTLSPVADTTPQSASLTAPLTRGSRGGSAAEHRIAKMRTAVKLAVGGLPSSVTVQRKSAAPRHLPQGEGKALRRRGSHRFDFVRSSTLHTPHYSSFLIPNSALKKPMLKHGLFIHPHIPACRQRQGALAAHSPQGSYNSSCVFRKRQSLPFRKGLWRAGCWGVPQGKSRWFSAAPPQ